MISLDTLCQTQRDARYHYAKRFDIEASYRLSE